MSSGYKKMDARYYLPTRHEVTAQLKRYLMLLGRTTTPNYVNYLVHTVTYK